MEKYLMGNFTHERCEVKMRERRDVAFTSSSGTVTIGEAASAALSIREVRQNHFTGELPVRAAVKKERMLDDQLEVETGGEGWIPDKT